MNFIVKSGREKADGTVPIYIFTHVAGRKGRFQTGISPKKTYWDDKNSCVRGEKAEDYNLIISNCKARLNDIFVKYRLQSKRVSIAALKSEYIKPDTGGDFIKFIASRIAHEKGLNSEGTTKTHNTLVYKLQRFKHTIYFSDISVDFVEEFKKHLIKKEKNNPNTVQKTLGILKKFVRLAVKKKQIEEDPFKEIKIKRITGDRTYLSEEQVAILYKAYITEKLPRRLHLVLRYFLFSCFTSLRLSDVVLFSRANIIGNMIVIQPQKTKGNQKIVKIPICDKARVIIGNIDSIPEKQPIFFTYSDQKTNEYIKEVMTALEIKVHISFHCARHTFATLFLSKTKNLAVLQKLMGHYSIIDTMVYAHVLNEDVELEMKCFDNLNF